MSCLWRTTTVGTDVRKKKKKKEVAILYDPDLFKERPKNTIYRSPVIAYYII